MHSPMVSLIMSWSCLSIKFHLVMFVYNFGRKTSHYEKSVHMQDCHYLPTYLCIINIPKTFFIVMWIQILQIKHSQNWAVQFWNFVLLQYNAAFIYLFVYKCIYFNQRTEYVKACEMSTEYYCTLKLAHYLKRNWYRTPHSL